MKKCQKCKKQYRQYQWQVTEMCPDCQEKVCEKVRLVELCQAVEELVKLKSKQYIINLLNKIQ